jgi:hypothetical protein
MNDLLKRALELQTHIDNQRRVNDLLLKGLRGEL